jgi:hypothetical protein
MKITITHACGIEGEIVDVDETVDVAESVAKSLVAMGRAIPYVAPAKPAKSGETKP